MVNIQVASNGIIVEGQTGVNGEYEKTVYKYDEINAETEALAMVDSAETMQVSKIAERAQTARDQIANAFTEQTA